MSIEGGYAITQSDEWADAIYACLDAIRALLPKGKVPAEEAATTARILAEVAVKLTFYQKTLTGRGSQPVRG